MALTAVPRPGLVAATLDVAKFFEHLFADFFVDGFTPTDGGGLTLNIASGNARIKGVWVNESAATTQTMTASTTNYVYLQLTQDAQNRWNGAQYVVNTTGVAPSTSIKIAEVVTGVSTITTITDKRTLIKIASPSAIELLGADPTGLGAKDEGRIWYRTDLDRVKYWDGTTAREVVGSLAAGDLLYASAANVLAKLAIGASGNFLKSDGSVPSWAAAPATSVYITDDDVNSATITTANVDVVLKTFDNLSLVFIFSIHVKSGDQTTGQTITVKIKATYDDATTITISSNAGLSHSTRAFNDFYFVHTHDPTAIPAATAEYLTSGFGANTEKGPLNDLFPSSKSGKKITKIEVIGNATGTGLLIDRVYFVGLKA